MDDASRRRLGGAIVVGLMLLAATTGRAQVTAYTDQVSFEAALDASFTLINLDDAPMVGFSPPYLVEDAGPAAALAGLGVDFQTFDASVADGQAFQITQPGRDRLVANGSGSIGGNVVIDLVAPVHGFGVWSNVGDGGRVRAFSGAGLGGTFLGEAPLGSGGFAGLVSSAEIRSVEVTCEFDFDLRCGLYDLQHGRQVRVPIDSRLSWLLALSLGLLGSWMIARRRAARAA